MTNVTSVAVEIEKSGSILRLRLQDKPGMEMNAIFRDNVCVDITHGVVFRVLFIFTGRESWVVQELFLKEIESSEQRACNGTTCYQERLDDVHDDAIVRDDGFAAADFSGDDLVCKEVVIGDAQNVMLLSFWEATKGFSLLFCDPM